MNMLGSLQNISGLEGISAVPLSGLAELAKDRCCSAPMASGDPVAPVATSKLLFQQSLFSLSALLLQLLQPPRMSASAGDQGGAVAKGSALQSLGQADPSSGSRRASGRNSTKSSVSNGDPTGGGPVSGRPNGYSEIVSQFGQPGDRGNIVSVPMKAGPGGRTVPVQVHKKIADRLKNTFEEISAAGLSDEIKTFDGSYNARKKRGGSTWSVHSWGLAVDLNAGQYPMGTSAASTSPRYKQIAQIFARNGFYQLGNDPMHFQFATGY